MMLGEKYNSYIIVQILSYTTMENGKTNTIYSLSF